MSMQIATIGKCQAFFARMHKDLEGLQRLQTMPVQIIKKMVTRLALHDPENLQE